MAATPQPPPSPFPPTPVPPVHPAPLGVAASRAGIMTPTLPWHSGFQQHLWGSSLLPCPCAAGRAFQRGSALLPPPHNGDNGVQKAENGREGSGSCLTFRGQSEEPGLALSGGRERSSPPARAGARARCPPELSAPITALNGRGRPPAQGAFIPLDGNQEKWENAALRGLGSPSCDVSVSDFTGNQRRGQGPPGWERLFLPHGPFPGWERWRLCHLVPAVA